MTPEQITLVQQSFAKVAPISAQAAVLFYDRLFEVAPSEGQRRVETLGVDGALEPLRVGVRLCRSNRRLDDLDAFAAEHLVEGCAELAYLVVD